ncbi:Phospholipase-like [Parasponia andersonii]|uniref:Phospholipase-like n=1 Tax=Parasponia andersonii TaxID=3476 RepID=A0A2P5B435_PARAD|nr:Phospholipase-like [Parasponia andersonii]
MRVSIKTLEATGEEVMAEVKVVAGVTPLNFSANSMIVTALRHGDGDIETVKINDRRGKKVESGSTLKFKATVDNLPEDEKAVFESCFGWNASIFDWEQRLASSRGPHLTPSTTPKLSRFTREYFERFIDWLGGYYYFERQELKYHKKHVEFVVVGRYTVPRNLSRILVLMLRKHGDISSHSESTREMKSIVFSCLCEVLHSMSTTRVRDLTQDHLKEWYFYLNFGRGRGFNVEFLSETLKTRGTCFSWSSSNSNKTLW